MGTMSDEMKKVMAKWSNDTPVQAETAPQPEPRQEEKMPEPRITMRDFIWSLVDKNPGKNSNQIMEILNKTYSGVPHSSVSAALSMLHQGLRIRREEAVRTGVDRTMYVYFSIEPKETERLRKERDRKLAQAQARAERARQAKLDKAKEREQANKAQINLPFEPPPLLPVPPVPETVVVSTAPDLRNMTAMEILRGINFAQAKELYKELKEAFGG